METNKQPTKKYAFKALLNKQGSPRAESAGPSPSQSDVSKIKLIAAAHAAESSVAIPPLKHVNNQEEDEILNLIQKNLLYEKHKKKKTENVKAETKTRIKQKQKTQNNK